MKNEFNVLIILAATILITSCAVISRPTVTQLIPNPPVFMVAYPLHFKNKEESYQNEIVVPIGFVTDLASIPRLLWWWQAPHEGTMAPAIIHDYLYWTQACTKDEADAVLYLALLDIGMGSFEANMIYMGVRTWIADESWRKNKIVSKHGESRFFTEDYAKRILDSNVKPKVTFVSMLSDANKDKGINAVGNGQQKLSSEKNTCTESLKIFNGHQTL